MADSYNDELGEDFDEFRTSTGLKDDYDGTVTDAYFGKDQRGGDRNLLFLKVSATDGDEVELRYSTGNGWVSYDGGRTVEHPTEKWFNNRTAIAELMKAAMMIPEAQVELGRRSHQELDRRGPKDAKLWVGLGFHWEVKTETMNVPERDALGQPVVEDGRAKMVTIEVPRTLPTAYLGVAGQDPTSNAAPAGKGRKPRSATSSATGGSTTTPPATNGAGDKALLAKLSVGAKTKTFNDWVDWAMDLPGVLEDDEIVSRLGDQDFYESLKA